MPSKIEWTPARIQLILDLYTLTPLGLDYSIPAFAKQCGFEVKKSALYIQLKDMLGPDYTNYHLNGHPDYPLLVARLYCITMDQRTIVDFMNETTAKERLNEMHVEASCYIIPDELLQPFEAKISNFWLLRKYLADPGRIN
ncbi:hypothetical protein VTL71DRAFT_6843 [Oculimacula yallundae]|uniref:Uncharacterized protein n=1 Tax=Oculimacula yallundae TaxID=86028 RepID=A0ABR4BV26_9HELO